MPSLTDKIRNTLGKCTYGHLKKVVFEAAGSQATEPCRVMLSDATNAHLNNETVIVLLGWGGAKERHLRRLREEYSKRGFSTLVFLPSMWGVVESSACEGAAAELLLALRDHLNSLPDDSDKPPRIIFHTHSNNSSFFFPSLMHCMKYSVFAGVANAYTGTIYDSNPGHGNLKNIPQPTEFKTALDNYYSEVKRAEKPLTVEVRNTSAAGDVQHKSPESEHSSQTSANNQVVVPALPLDEGKWQGTLQSRSLYPHIWLPSAMVMSIVTNPVICGKYFHPWWTLVCFTIFLKEFAHTGIRCALHNILPNTKNTALTIRFADWLTPNAKVAMDKVATLLAESEVDGFKGNKSAAMRQLMTAHPLGPGLNRLARHPIKAPELFLYSKKDVLIAYWDIERFMYTRLASQYSEDKVPFIFAHRFDHTPHVAHYQKEPVVYMECVDNFVQFALKEKAKATSNAYPKQHWI